LKGREKITARGFARTVPGLLEASKRGSNEPEKRLFKGDFGQPPEKPARGLWKFP
jgi:hypothetical protein